MVAALVLGGLGACSGGHTAVGDSRHIVDDDARFATSYEAGDAFAHIGGRLLRAGKACDGRCDPLLSASAYAQVLAVRVLDCTAPGRFKMRKAMRAYLDAIDGLGEGARAPQPPSPPQCSR